MDRDAVSHEADYDPDEGSDLAHDSAGRPVTNAYLEHLADELERDEVLPAGTIVEFQVRGRPSLTAPGEKSPTVHFRVPARLRSVVEQRARREGKSVSALAREALERYVS